MPAATADTTTAAPAGAAADPENVLPVASTKAPVNTGTLLKLTTTCGFVPSKIVENDVTVKLIVGPFASQFA